MPCLPHNSFRFSSSHTKSRIVATLKAFEAGLRQQDPAFCKCPSSLLSIMPPTLDTFRQQFPALQNKAYFNYGGQGPMPEQAIAAIQQAHHHTQTIGPFSNAANSWIAEKMEGTRTAIAAELQVAPATVTLTEDVTVGCNIPLWGLDWREGDHILLSDCEHPGVIAAIAEIRHRFGVKVSTCPLLETLNAGDPAAVIAQHLRPTTRLLVISHILWNTGQVLPLAKIMSVCRQHPTQSAPVRVLVDAAQSVGVLPLNLVDLEVDFYAFTCHKWLCGPAGIGGLYIQPECLSEIRPTFIGWRGITKNPQGYPTGWQPDGRRFEIATSDFTLYSGLQAAIATHHTWGTASDRYQRIVELSAYLWQHLNELPHITCLRAAPPESGLVSFQVQSSLCHDAIVKTLEKQGFFLRTLLYPDCIRACVHYLTLTSEVDRLVKALAVFVS